LPGTPAGTPVGNRRHTPARPRSHQAHPRQEDARRTHYVPPRPRLHPPGIRVLAPGAGSLQTHPRPHTAHLPITLITHQGIRSPGRREGNQTYNLHGEQGRPAPCSSTSHNKGYVNHCPYPNTIQCLILYAFYVLL
jgi:hypothetical protein